MPSHNRAATKGSGFSAAPALRRKKEWNMATNKEEVVDSAVSLPESGSAGADPDEATIAALAYQLWLAKGCPIGRIRTTGFSRKES